MTTNAAYPDLPVMLVDDESEFLQSASFSLRSSGINNILKCQDSREVLTILKQQSASVILCDLLMPFKGGKEVLSEIVTTFPALPVVMLTAVNEAETAVECLKLGAFDYLVKPVDKTRLVTTVRKALEFSSLQTENSRLAASLLTFDSDVPAGFRAIITESESMLSLFRYLHAVAPTPYPILIQGETGTGKELFAAAIHASSGRKGAFMAVNSAGLDDALFTDTLFGHEKGAFTGADKKRDGLVSKAMGGTLFLDEIGDLKVESQVRLLRLLENGTYFPVGSDSERSAEIRIIAATNAGLEKAVAEGRFRRDLYFRLRGHSVVIPPLRERPADLHPLTRYFMKAVATELGKPVPTPPPQLFSLLSAYGFPGNVRELKTMVADAVSRHTGGILSLSSFKNTMDHAALLDPGLLAAESTSASTQEGIHFGPALPTLRDAEEVLVAEALKRCKGNQTQAARLLGITPSALNKRLNK